MRIGVLDCSDDDCRQITEVAESIGASVIVYRELPSAINAGADGLFVSWRADASVHTPLEAIRLSRAPVVILLDRYSPELRLKAFVAGAHDVLCSPVDPSELLAEIQSLSSDEPPAEAVRRAEFELIVEKLFVGVSISFKRCVEQLRKATLVDANVLLLGERGTGKEVFARALHRASHRSSEPFRGVNCAAIPEHLLESELFGSRKGAFSGAENLVGQFEAVGAGTLLLDEIGEMPFALQAKFLRVVQEREFQPLGSSKLLAFMARLVAATLVDPREAVSRGRFRADLIERLDQFRIVLPPLRERREDISLLARHFLRARSQGRPLEISVSAMRMLEEADFPGNIRELENTIIKAIAEAAPGTNILPQHLPRDLYRTRPVMVAADIWRIDESLKYSDAREQAAIEVDRIYLGRFLHENQNNKTEAAKAAHIDRKTFWDRWKRAGGKDEE